MSKSEDSRPGGGSAVDIAGWPLRRKVALALAVPLLLAATLGGLRVQNDLTEAANSASSAQQVTVLRPTIAYLTAAESAMVAAQSTTESSAVELDAALNDVKSAARDLADVRADAELTPEQSYQVDVILDLSRALREGSTETLSPGTWIAQLRQLQSGVTKLVSTIVNAQIDPEPRLELLAQTLAGRFSLAMQQALAATERTGETGSLELFAELGVEGAAIDRLASAVGDSESAVATMRTANAQRFRTVRTGGADLGGLEAYTDYDALVTKLLDGVDDQLAANASDARRAAFVNAAITLGALLAAGILGLLISPLLLNPIRRVREGALAVANERLPEAVARIRAGEQPGEIEPIDVDTEEEIGQLARAFDDMHRQAVHLASGEAALRSQVGEMFVTLSRRNTSLINQQLGLIEKLEKDEEDPRRLEALFRLDHLAARMRRTADSLLILADAPTHSGAGDRLTVGDALQAATAGVQDYQRVRIGSAVTTRIADEAAADVVHLLTELVDNALTYSPPTTNVTVSSTQSPDGVAIEVTDTGLGIPENYLAEINHTLSKGADVSPDTARRMGLFVVSRLAQRHGILASLRRNGSQGIVARIFLPNALLPDTVQAPKPVEPAPVAEKATKPAPVRAPAPAATAGATDLDSIEARINAVIGLPQRRPGTSVNPGEPAAAAAGAPLMAPRKAESTPEPTPEPVVEPVAAEPAVEPEPTPEPVAVVPQPEPEPVAVVEPEPVAEVTQLRAVEPVADTPEPQPDPEPAAAPVRRSILEPAPVVAPAAAPVAVPVAAVAGEPAVQHVEHVEQPVAAAPTLEVVSALDGPLERSSDDEGAGFDTPIFRSMRSAWLSAGGTEEPWKSSEVEAGWDRAESVTAPAVETPVSPSGLPMRRPGNRLVPGGITKPATVAARDPEALRARLQAHAAGVSRGRTAATSTDRTNTEAGPA